MIFGWVYSKQEELVSAEYHFQTKRILFRKIDNELLSQFLTQAFNTTLGICIVGIIANLVINFWYTSIILGIIHYLLWAYLFHSATKKSEIIDLIPEERIMLLNKIVDDSYRFNKVFHYIRIPYLISSLAIVILILTCLFSLYITYLEPNHFIFFILSAILVSVVSALPLMFVKIFILVTLLKKEKK